MAFKLFNIYSLKEPSSCNFVSKESVRDARCTYLYVCARVRVCMYVNSALANHIFYVSGIHSLFLLCIRDTLISGIHSPEY
jgi:hypothetical protein